MPETNNLIKLKIKPLFYSEKSRQSQSSMTVTISFSPPHNPWGHGGERRLNSERYPATSPTFANMVSMIGYYMS